MGRFLLTSAHSPEFVAESESWTVLDRGEDLEAFFRDYTMDMQRAVLFTLGPHYM